MCTCECQDELQELRRKLWVIDELDRIRVGLRHLDPRANFRETILNRHFKAELEDLFQRPMWNIREYYFDLVNERNSVCHARHFREMRVRFK